MKQIQNQIREIKINLKGGVVEINDQYPDEVLDINDM